jgi:hypothetical protein
VSAEPAPEPQTPDTFSGTELDRRSARKDGREIVTLRHVDAGGAHVIECDVYPVNGLRVDPLRPGPYRFGTSEEAESFIDEIVKSLTYLGCDVA